MPLLVLGLAVSITSAFAEPELPNSPHSSLPYHFDLQYQGFGGSCRAADANGDGSDEIYVFGDDQEGVSDCVVRLDLEPGGPVGTWQVNLSEGSICDVVVVDLNSDGVKELCIAVKSERSFWVECHRRGSPEETLSSLHIQAPDRNGDGAWTGSIDFGEPADLDGDGVPDLLCGLGAGFDLEPRGLVVFSGRDLSTLGTYPTAGSVAPITCRRASPSGPLIVLIATNSTDNGNRVGPYDDSHAYLIALDRTLQQVWRVCIAGYPYASRFIVNDIDGDDALEVIHERFPKEDMSSQPSRLEVRDLATGNVERYRDLPASLTQLLSGDLDRDTRPELVIGLRSGQMMVLDGELTPVSTTHFDVPPSPRWLGDLNRDGEREVLGTLTNNTLIMLDSRLNLLAMREFAFPVYEAICVFDADGAGHVVTRGQDIAFLRLAAGPDTAAILSQRSLRLPVLWLLSGVVCGALLTWIAVVLILHLRHNRHERHRFQIRQTRESLLSALQAFGHSGLARNNLERLAIYAEAAREVEPSRRKEYARRLRSIVRTYQEFSRQQLEKIVALAHDQDLGIAHPDRLRRACTDLATYLTSAEEAADAPQTFTKRLDEIAGAARCVLRETLAIRQASIAAFSCDVFGVVSRVLANLKDQLDAAGVEEIETSSGHDCRARVSEECLQTCLEILIINASEAMAASQTRRLAVTVTSANNQVLVSLTDTGCGVAHGDHEKIFEKGVSTKGEGHGLGLYHARHALALFGGSLRVVESEVDKGATFEIRLKAAAIKNAPAIPKLLAKAEQS